MTFRWLVTTVLIAASIAHASTISDGWSPSGKGITGNLSGLAVGRDGALYAVHDNKLPGEPRLSRVGGRDTSHELHTLIWQGDELPIDLEALSEIPGRDDEFLALASEGKVFHLHIVGETARVLGSFRLPGAKPFLANNYESLRLQTLHGETVAVWAHRGGLGRDALIFVAPFHLARYQFGAGTVYRLRAPWPESHRRDASDVVILRSGEVLVSAASDPGDDGPFSSTLYRLGALSRSVSGIWELPATPTRHLVPREAVGARYARKIEALAVRRGNLVLGTDDENDGGWIRSSDGIMAR